MKQNSKRDKSVKPVKKKIVKKPNNQELSDKKKRILRLDYLQRRDGKFSNIMKQKFKIMSLVILCMFFVLIGSTLYTVLFKGDEYEKKALAQQYYASTDIPYKRGDILDRKKNVLASSIQVYDLVIEPKNILGCSTNEEKVKEVENIIINALNKYFGLNKKELRNTIENNPNSYYELLIRDLSYDEVREYQEIIETDYSNLKKSDIEDMSDEEREKYNLATKVVGVRLNTTYKRYYPYDSLACHVIGYTLKDDNDEDAGEWGLEAYYDSELTGINGKIFSYYNEYLELERSTEPAINGNKIVTTIDISVQKTVEKYIAEFQEEVGSKKTSVVVMNPNNGEVLAMATSDPYNLNDRESSLKEYKLNKQSQENDEKSEVEIASEFWKNIIITDTFEPGSTFKPFTVAMGLEEGILTGDETYNCTGSMKVGNRTINCNKTTGHGVITLQEAIMESCNVALMKIGLKIGTEIFTRYQSIFGFGLKTNIDLLGEAYTASLMHSPDEISDVDLATNAFGQNFNCSIIQLATGFCSLINGGYYYEPHIVKQILNENNNIVKNLGSVLVKKTVSKQTSDTLKTYLFQTVENGTAKKAQVEGYTVGGKTGTAEKQPRNHTDYVVSFIGFTPVDNPEVLVYVVIDEPDSDNQANSGYAIGVAQKIMTEILPYLNVPKRAGATSTTATSSESNTESSTTEVISTTEEIIDEEIIN